MTKTLLSTTFAALVALNVSACAQATPASYKPHLSVLAEKLPLPDVLVDISALQGTRTGAATLLKDVDARGADDPAPCSETLRAMWTVTGTEVTDEAVNPSGNWADYKGRIDSIGHLTGITVTSKGHGYPLSVGSTAIAPSASCTSDKTRTTASSAST